MGKEIPVVLEGLESNNRYSAGKEAFPSQSFQKSISFSNMSSDMRPGFSVSFKSDGDNKNSGMNSIISDQNRLGGDQMQQQEIILGQATYVISRIHTGDQTVSHLIKERLAQNIFEHFTFDEQPLKTYN